MIPLLLLLWFPLIAALLCQSVAVSFPVCVSPLVFVAGSPKASFCCCCCCCTGRTRSVFGGGGGSCCCFDDGAILLMDLLAITRHLHCSA